MAMANIPHLAVVILLLGDVFCKPTAVSSTGRNYTLHKSDGRGGFTESIVVANLFKYLLVLVFNSY